MLHIEYKGNVLCIKTMNTAVVRMYLYGSHAPLPMIHAAPSVLGHNTTSHTKKVQTHMPTAYSMELYSTHRFRCHGNKCLNEDSKSQRSIPIASRVTLNPIKYLRCGRSAGVYKSYINICGYCAGAFIAKPKGEASNRDALSSPVCIYVCMYVFIYVYPSLSTRDT